MLDLFKQFQPDILESTFAWHIYNLKQKKIIFPLGRGIYSLKAKPKFQPVVSDKLKRIYLAVKRKNISDNLCIWDSSWFNEFMIHQPMQNVITLETDADVLETVYYHLKDHIYKKVFMQPDEKQMEQYVLAEKEPVILLPYISRSSCINIDNVAVPVLEKLLIDIFFNRSLYYWFQGKELINIFEEANSRYLIQYSVLISYARRRGVHEKLKNFLLRETNYPQEFFL